MDTQECGSIHFVAPPEVGQEEEIDSTTLLTTPAPDVGREEEVGDVLFEIANRHFLTETVDRGIQVQPDTMDQGAQAQADLTEYMF